MVKRRPNGDGMIRKLEKQWEGRIVVGHKDNGSSIFRYFYGKTQKELIEKMHIKINEYASIELSERSKMTLEEWLEIWLEKYMKNTLRLNTFKGYEIIVKKYIIPRLGNKIISHITTNDIQKMYVELKNKGRIHPHLRLRKELADSSVILIHTTLHKAMDDALKEHLIIYNPTNGTKLPKKRKTEFEVLNEENLQKFIKEIEKEELWYDIFYTELTTGLRRGELCGLKWIDFDEDEGILYINRSISIQERKVIEGETKTGQSKRNIYLPQTTVEILKRRKLSSQSEWIFNKFIDPTKPIYPNSVYNKFKLILRKAQLPNIRFHDLRHTFATTAITNGVDAKTLSQILGHTNASFTLDTYTHTTTDMQKRASELIESYVEEIFGKDLELI